MTYTLYAFWRTSATYRVRVALNLKGILADERLVNLGAGEQRSPAYLAINPMAGIPALVAPGQAPITQSLAILEYLEEAHPRPALLPRDLHGRARVRSLAGLLACDTHPLITPRVKKIPRWLARFRRRGLARLANSLVFYRALRTGAAPVSRARDRAFLPRRPAQHGRHLLGQHRGRDEGFWHLGSGHPHGGSHRRPVRQCASVCQRSTGTPKWARRCCRNNR